MNRLVTDNPQNNTEIMMNLAFVKDKEVWIRGGGDDGEDCTLIDFTNRMCASHDCLFDITPNEIDEEDIDITPNEIDEEDIDITPNEIDEEDIDNTGDRLLECSMNGCPIGTTYFIAIQAAELRERLRKYEEKDTPVFPKKRINNRGFQYYYCGKCGHQLPAGFPKRCDNCGRPVKRDDI